MRNILFCFSGTGNSLAVAHDVAERVGGTEVKLIQHVTDEDKSDMNFERIGFVFPVYYAYVPAIVERFVRKLSFNKTQYIFAIVTYGGSLGGVFTQFEKLVQEKGGLLNAGFTVLMPGNYVDKYDAFPAWLQKREFKREKKKVNAVSAAIRAKKSTRIPKGRITQLFVNDSVVKKLAGLGDEAKNFRTTEKCNGCGTCERICPDKNITLSGGKPVWGSKCEHCVACIQWCPTRAIEYGEITVNRKRYRHPEIKASDLMIKK